MKTLTFTVMALISLLVITTIYSLFAHSTFPADYHIECIGNGEVKLMDENYKEIRATTIDSIGYYIIEDNI
jgi:hypothetical protein